MADNQTLSTYLNNHHAGGDGAIQLAAKAARNNAGTPLGTFLSKLQGDFEDDMASLHRILDLLAIQAVTLKQVAGKVGEAVSRLKLHEKVTGDPDLSRLMELETLTMGITGKSDLWQALTELARTDTRLASVDLARLAGRAQNQLQGVKEQHRLIAATLFGGG